MPRSRMRAQAATGIVVLALAAAACSSSGSTGSSASSGQPVSLTYWSSSSQAEINWLDTHFNATHKGITVHGQYIASSDNLTTKVVSALKTGTEPNVLLGATPSSCPSWPRAARSST
jgi:ABC-type glycerol-3-phosphate transport system substrate-binding protein